MTTTATAEQKWSIPVRVETRQWKRFTRAPMMRRLLAVFIDGSVVSVLQLLPASLFYMLGIFVDTQGAGAALAIRVLYFSINMSLWAMYVAYFYQHYGATPGKLLLGMRVLDRRWGTNPSLSQTLNREFVGKFLSFLVLGGGFIIAFFDRRHGLTLHDRISNTQVVYVPKRNAS